MMQTAKPTRIVGIAVSKKNLGFCIFEGHGFLLDWGVKKMADRKSETIAKMLAFILEFYMPMEICLQDVEYPDCKLSKENTKVIHEIQKNAKSKEIPVGNSSWADVKLHLGLSDKDNMDMVAQKITEQFPILFEFLPSTRKPWEGEYREMVLFKAIALALPRLKQTA